MKKQWIIPAALIAMSLTACGGAETTETGTTDSTATETTEVIEATLDNPFPELADEPMNANVGEYVFAAKNHTLEAYKDTKFEDLTESVGLATVVEPGTPKSKLNSVGDKEISNYLIITFAPGATAQVGDIVVAPWHHGGSMKRAIVTNATDPARPTVNFIDIDWENPATGDGGVGYGKEETQLEANTFFVLNAEWLAGSTVAIKNGNDWEEHILLKVSGDKILAMDWSSKIRIHDKANCKSIEVKGDFKVGDVVQAPKYGTYEELTITKIDSKFGRIYCVDEYEKINILPMGCVTKTL